MRVILSRSLCLYYTYGALAPASHPVFSHAFIIDAILTKYVGPLALQAVIHTRVRHVLSHSDVTYICVHWEEKNNPRRPFTHLLQSCRRCSLGDDHRNIPFVLKTLFREALS